MNCTVVDTLFSDEIIIKHLISKRVSLAKKRHDKAILEGYCKSDSLIPSTPDNDLINRVMPCRNTWVSLGKEARKKVQDSVSMNKIRLFKTIQRDRLKEQPPQYVTELNNLISDIQMRGISDSYTPSKPKIIPKRKNNKDIKEGLRPICIFGLEDNIILKCVNSYLTRLFDPLFLDCSYAFRGRKAKSGVPTHHNTIDCILEFQEKHQGTEIYVAECDLKKFFDTINHHVIKKSFYSAICEVGLDIPYDVFGVVERVFLGYLNSYGFQEDVWALNESTTYLSGYGCVGGEFKWIEPSILENVYDDYHTCRLGIPQGGALSGLIANCVLDYVDKRVMDVVDEDFLYLRYCDDMIMMHTDKEKLEERLGVYSDAIKAQKLFVHDPETIDSYSRQFYSRKSKKPYKWGGNLNEGEIPWVSFVGYQIGFNGEVRVRKASIDKEVEKQKWVVSSSIRHINKNNKKTGSNLRTIQSIYNRLCGMSVGRVKLYSYYSQTDNSMCWTKGFNRLTFNKFAAAQMRYLDRRRRIAFRWFCKELKKDSRIIEKNSGVFENRDREIIYWGKPFSYYGWLEKKHDSKRVHN